MPKSFSLYLDFFRFCAAMAVLIYHAMEPEMGYPPMGFPFGFEAVMGFFVLSGFVIAYVVDQRESTPQAFMAARLSRLWSVVLPAIIIVPVLDQIGMHLNSAPYVEHYKDQGPSNTAAAVLLTPLLLNQTWFNFVDLFSNRPIWSLSYEFCYYLLFCAWAFSRGSARLALIAVIVLVFGPKILLLLPIWLSGVAIYKWRDQIPGSPTLGMTLMISTVFFIFLARAEGLFFTWFHYSRQFLDYAAYEASFGFSSNFPYMLLIGALMAMHVIGAWLCLRDTAESPAWLGRPVKFFAERSFGIYLFHYPVQFVVAAAVWKLDDAGLRLACVIAGSFVISFSLASIFEPMKKPLRTWLEPKLAKLIDLGKMRSLQEETI